MYSGTSLIRTPMGQKSVIVSEVSSFQRLKCMQEWPVLGVGKGVLFGEVSSVQGYKIEGFHCSSSTKYIV